MLSFAVRASNVGTGPITIDPISDLEAEVKANGSPTGLVTLQSPSSKMLSPGARTRFRFQWDYRDIAAGDSISYEGYVNVADVAAGGNVCDTAKVTTR